MRRPKPVALTEEELDQATEGSPLARLKSRLSRNETALANRQISTPFAALDAMEALYVAHLKGYSHEQLSPALPDAWGEDTVAIPLPVLAVLAFGWSEYRNAPAGRTLGECFKIEGVGGQGKAPAKKIVHTKRRAFGHAYAVLKEYALAMTQGTPCSIDDAISLVSDRRDVSYQTVKDALRQHRDEVEALLRDEGWWK